MFINKNLQLNNSKTKTATDAKISIFICVEAIIYLLLHNLHDCTFKEFFSKCYQIRREVRIWSQLLKKNP